MIYGVDAEVQAIHTAASASNINTGDNPTAYTISDFLDVYPQFGSPNVPSQVAQLYIDLANATIKEARWHKAWPIATGLFVAHFCTLWMRGSANPTDNKDTIIDAGYTEGIITSSSVDGVSYSMDITTSANDLEGYAAWKSTSYGIQLATLAKMYGKGGMAVR